MILNGKEYPVPEVKKYSDLVKYEAKGIKIMAIAEASFYDPANTATSVVRGISYFTGLSFEEALYEVDSHLEAGNSLDDLLEDMLKDTEKMKENGAIEGFSKRSEDSTRSQETESSEVIDLSQYESFTEIINKVWLPQALSLGIDYNLFWELSPKRTEPFVKASKLKLKLDNINMWKQGLYIQSAVASVLSEKNKYYEEPIDFEAEHTEEQEAAKWKAWAMNVNSHTVLHKSDEYE